MASIALARLCSLQALQNVRMQICNSAGICGEGFAYNPADTPKTPRYGLVVTSGPLFRSQATMIDRCYAMLDIP
jgi:hypothetical protein